MSFNRFLFAASVALLLAGCGDGESAESAEAPAEIFGVIVEAQEPGVLFSLRGNELLLDDGTVVRWEGENSSEVSGCDFDAYVEQPSIIGCPVYAWVDETGLARRVLGASYLVPGFEGSEPFWGIPGELYRRADGIAVMSTGQFEFEGDESMLELRETCKSTPRWKIDPASGAVIGFEGWGSALFDQPCDWNI